MHQVAIPDNIFLALQAHFAGFLGRRSRHRSETKVVVSDGLGADKALLEVGVDLSRRPCGAVAPSQDSPGARFLRARGEEGNQVEQVVSGTDQPVEAGLLQPQLVQILAAFGIVELGQLRLDSWPRSRRRSGAFGPLAAPACELGDAFPRPGARIVVARSGGGFVNIAHVEDAFRGEEVQRPECQPCPRPVYSASACRFAVAQLRQRRLDQSKRLVSRPCPARGSFFSSGSIRFSRLSMSASISSVSTVSASASGSILPVNMGHVVIVETAQHVGDGIDFADMGEELVAEPFALGSAPCTSPAMSTKVRRVGSGAFRLRHFRNFFEPRIGHRHLAHIGLDRAKGVVRGLRRGSLRQGVEECGLADIGQPDDAAFESHCSCPCRASSFARLSLSVLKLPVGRLVICHCQTGRAVREKGLGSLVVFRLVLRLSPRGPFFDRRRLCQPVWGLLRMPSLQVSDCRTLSPVRPRS